MYNVTIGEEDFYYDNVTERRIAVFNQEEDARQFAENYWFNPITAYIKVTDDNDVLVGHRKNTKNDEPRKKMGFA